MDSEALKGRRLGARSMFFSLLCHQLTSGPLLFFTPTYPHDTGTNPDINVNALGSERLGKGERWRQGAWDAYQYFFFILFCCIKWSLINTNYIYGAENHERPPTSQTTNHYLHGRTTTDGTGEGHRAVRWWTQKSRPKDVVSSLVSFFLLSFILFSRC